MCLEHIDSTIPLLPKSEIFKLWLQSLVRVLASRKPRRQIFFRDAALASFLPLKVSRFQYFISGLQYDVVRFTTTLIR